MAYSSRYLAGLVLLALMFFGTVAPAKDIPCTTRALEYLMPCQPFLTGNGEFTSACCLAAQALAQATASQTDGTSVNQCLKQLSVNIDQKKVKQLPQLCNHHKNPEIADSPPTTPGHSPGIGHDTPPHSQADVRFEYNRYKNPETADSPPTTPGHSPGIGHDTPPHSQADVRFESNRYKNPETAESPPTTPGHSPGIGHDTPPHSQADVRFESNRYKNPETADSPPTTPGHSPGIGHDTPPPLLAN